MKSQPVTVVGAGFSGLVAAFYLVREGFHVRVIEKSPRAGGLIQTIEDDFGLTETAANGVLNSALLEELFQAIGLQVEPTLKASRKRFIFRDGKPRRWPLSWRASLRVLRFLFTYIIFRAKLAPRAVESVRSWGARTLGEEATRTMLEAALQGIYAGDPTRLSATLILGRHFSRDRAKQKPPRIRGTVCAPGGMGQLIGRLRYYLEKRGVEFHFEETFALGAVVQPDQPVVITGSAADAAKLLAPVDSERSRALAQVELLPLLSATLVFDTPVARAQGFGCLFPPVEARPMLGVLMNTFIFPGRSKRGFSETWIFGGASSKSAAVLQLRDQEIINLIERQRGECFLTVSELLNARLTRWPIALPHYTCEFEKTLPIIRKNRQNVFLIGNYTGEIGLSRILASAAVLGQEIRQKGEWN